MVGKAGVSPPQETKPATAVELLLACEEILEVYVRAVVGLSIQCFIREEQVFLRFWRQRGLDEKHFEEINKIINRLNCKTLHPKKHTAEKVGDENGLVPDIHFRIKPKKEKKKKKIDVPSLH